MEPIPGGVAVMSIISGAGLTYKTSREEKKSKQLSKLTLGSGSMSAILNRQRAEILRSFLETHNFSGLSQEQKISTVSTLQHSLDDLTKAFMTMRKKRLRTNLYETSLNESITVQITIWVQTPL
jgi:hypothetical protein